MCVHEVGFVFRGVERMCDLSVGIRKFSFCVSSFTFSVCLSPRDFFFFFTSLSLLCYLSITNTSDTSDLIGHKQLISFSSFSPPPPHFCTFSLFCNPPQPLPPSLICFIPSVCSHRFVWCVGNMFICYFSGLYV